MDQRRFISFLMLSVAVMMLFSILFPPPPKPPQPAAPAAAGKEGAVPAGAGAQQADADAPAAPAEQPLAEGEAPLPAAAADDIPAQFLTLGSIDPDSGYRLAVTLSNAGAAVRRAELSSPRYRDQHDRSGYLGELELKPVEGGLEVQVVVPGTPAAQAGIKAGDVLVGIGAPQTVELRTPEEFRAALNNTEPGQSITLQVRSGGDGAPRAVVVEQLIWRPFAVLRPEIENYQMRDAEPPANFEDPASFLVTLAQRNGQPLDAETAKRLAGLLKKGNWEVADNSDTSVTFRRLLPEWGLEILKRYTLQPVPPEERENVDYPGYHLQMDLELRNTAAAAQSLAYQLEGPTGMPLEGWWYAHKISRHSWVGGAGLRDVVVRFDGNSVWQVDCPDIAAGDTAPMGDGQALAFAGVDGQYFSAVLLPIREELNDVWFDLVEAVVAGTPVDPRTPVTFTNVTCRMTRQSLQLQPGAAHRDSYRVFLGPKRPDLMAHYQAAGDPNHSLADIIYYGLALFGAVAKAMLAILHFFYSIVGNYGIAIVMLTVLVRGLMFPISFKQTQNMARLQALKPEMDRITEKFKGDMQKRSQAMQELYRKHNINPLGGCLPVFLQLPIFIGLYRALMVDVELRLSPLFGHGIRWCSNLAAPDMFLDWSPIMPAMIDSGTGLLALGPYLNILPIITVALFLVTQKMAMPEPTNEQQALQQKMMKWMTIFFGLLFYKVASGLCLYFIASSIWGIAERKLLPKSRPPAGSQESKVLPYSTQAESNASTTDGRNGSHGKKRSKAKRKR